MLAHQLQNKMTASPIALMYILVAKILYRSKELVCNWKKVSCLKSGVVVVVWLRSMSFGWKSMVLCWLEEDMRKNPGKLLTHSRVQIVYIGFEGGCYTSSKYSMILRKIAKNAPACIEERSLLLIQTIEVSLTQLLLWYQLYWECGHEKNHKQSRICSRK